jgi:hypothetical protein
MSEEGRKPSLWDRIFKPEPEEEPPRKDMNWSITWKVLLVSFVSVTVVVVALQKLLWPADEWECRRNIWQLNRACAKWNKAQLAAGNKGPLEPGMDTGLLVEDLTEPDPKRKKSYIELVLVKNGLLSEEDAKRILRTHTNERGETEEVHYYYLGEVAHSWDLYYTGLRVTRNLPDGPKAMNVSVKCNAHELNPMTIELLGVLILTGIVSIFAWSFMGYSLPFKDEEEESEPAEAAKS